MSHSAETLSPTKSLVASLTTRMEQAFVTGSVSRVLTHLTSHAPYASDPEALKARMASMPTLGWSCWDMTVLMVTLLREQGVDAGATIGFGAEHRAPAQPHSLVRVTEEDGSYFYSDPYFGVGIISRDAPFSRWHAATGYAYWTSPMRHSYTDKMFVNHKAHNREYGYQILPGVLSEEQLQGALWQAEEFGGSTQYLRGLGDGKLWRIVCREDRVAEQTQWDLSDQFATVTQTTGNWFELRDSYIEQTKNERADVVNSLLGA